MTKLPTIGEENSEHALRFVAFYQLQERKASGGALSSTGGEWSEYIEALGRLATEFGGKCRLIDPSDCFSEEAGLTQAWDAGLWVVFPAQNGYRKWRGDGRYREMQSALSAICRNSMVIIGP